jgi:hypothetical protein
MNPAFAADIYREARYPTQSPSQKLMRSFYYRRCRAKKSGGRGNDVVPEFARKNPSIAAARARTYPCDRTRRTVGTMAIPGGCEASRRASHVQRGCVFALETRDAPMAGSRAGSSGCSTTYMQPATLERWSIDNQHAAQRPHCDGLLNVRFEPQSGATTACAT